jgi:biopolymer transport protein ExbD
MRKPRSRLGVAIDMTPMVDVAFLLLIFFMTTTTFKPAEEVVIDLPVSHAKYKVPETGVLILTVGEDSQLYAQLGTNDVMKRLDMSQVGDLIRSERTRNSRLRLIVRADKKCPYGTMEDLMAVLQATRTNRFVLMTEGEDSGPAPTEEPGPSTDGASLGGGFGSAGAARLALVRSADAQPSGGSEETRWAR